MQTLPERIISFIEKLSITIGEDAGKPFVLRPWQRDFITAVFGPVQADGRRVVRRAVFSLPRKQGKSEIAAALTLCALIGPLSEPNGEAYSVANDRQQAAIIYRAVKRFIQASPHLSKYLRCVDSTKTIYVTRSDVQAAGSVYRALSSDAGRQHGLNPHFVIVDELAQTKSRELFDTMATSMGARSAPLLMVISTRSHDPTHVLEELIQDGLNSGDPSTVCQLYTADEGCDVQDEAQWYKANPALGDFLDLEEFRAAARRAARMPSEEQAFRLLRLNQMVSPVSSFVARADWEACGRDPHGDTLVQNEPIILALDIGVTIDLSALVAISAGDRDTRVQPWFWKPADGLEEQGKRDRQPYAEMARAGLLETCPGRANDPQAIAYKIAELVGRYDVRALVYDRYRIDTLLRELDRIGLAAQIGPGSGLRLEPWGQGFKDMAPAVDALELAILNGELVHPNHRLLTWMAANAIVVQDPAGNRKIDKDKARFRIDGFVALAMAIGFKARERQTIAAVNPWEDPTFSLKSWLNPAA